MGGAASSKCFIFCDVMLLNLGRRITELLNLRGERSCGRICGLSWEDVDFRRNFDAAVSKVINASGKGIVVLKFGRSKCDTDRVMINNVLSKNICEN